MCIRDSIDPYYGTPVVMSLTPDSAPLLALECTVAFILSLIHI